MKTRIIIDSTADIFGKKVPQKSAIRRLAA